MNIEHIVEFDRDKSDRSDALTLAKLIALPTRQAVPVIIIRLITQLVINCTLPLPR